MTADDRLERYAELRVRVGANVQPGLGPGTNLTVGLLPHARWLAARFRTASGIDYVPNMPTGGPQLEVDAVLRDGTAISLLRDETLAARRPVR